MLMRSFAGNLRPRDRKRRFLLIFCGILVVLSLFFGVLDSRVRPVAQTLALAELDNEVVGCVNSLIRQLTEEGTLNYDDLVNLRCDEAGNVIAMNTRMKGINDLRMTVGKGVSQVLDGRTRQRVRIPIGAALHWNLFTTLGPEISVELLHVGQVGISFDNRFQTVGIGQTAHTVTMTVTVDVLLMLPGGISNQTISCTVPLAESLLVGDIPQSYTSIIHGDQYNGAVSDSTALLNETSKEDSRWK